MTRQTPLFFDQIPKSTETIFGLGLIPSKDEQEQIVQTLRAVDCRLSNFTKKKQTLDELFRTLLHQLMTAKIRVQDLDLPQLEDAVAE
jgi:type I restriction enzyme S subunit